VITSNLDVTGNIFMRGDRFVVESETKLINDAIIGIANNNVSSATDIGILMQRPDANVAIIHHGGTNELSFAYTQNDLEATDITNDLSKELTINVVGHVITQNNLTVGGTLKLNTITAAATHSLQAVTGVGSVTSNTVQFSNVTTSLTADSNILVTGNVTAATFLGDGSGLTALPAAEITGVLPVIHGGTGVVQKTGTGSLVLSDTPTFTGTVTAVTFSGSGASLTSIPAAQITGTLAVANGGTGVTGSTGTGDVVLSIAPAFSGDVAFDTNTLFVDSTNNRVGVGTASPATALDVLGTIRVQTGTNDATGGEFSIDTNVGHIRRKVAGNGVSLTSYDDFQFYVNAIGGSAEGGTQAMIIDNSGNVGIGTTNPGEHLHIYHPTYGVHRSVYWNAIEGATTDLKMGYLGSSDPSHASGALGLFKNSYEGSTEDETVRIQGNGVSWFNGGNVGIGTTSPGTMLDIVKSGDPTLRIRDTDSDGKARIQLLESGSFTDGVPRYGTEISYDGNNNKFHISTFDGSTTKRDDLTITRSSGNVELSGYLKSANPAFYAYRTTPGNADGSYMTYDASYANLGNHMNVSAGIFTCPVAGIYTFTWGSIGRNNNNIYRYYIRKNNSQIDDVHLRADNTATGPEYSTGERTVMVSLVATDTIRIHYQDSTGSDDDYGYNYTYFQGHLISYT
jgi:hypothetical protein